MRLDACAACAIHWLMLSSPCCCGKQGSEYFFLAFGQSYTYDAAGRLTGIGYPGGVG